MAKAQRAKNERVIHPKLRLGKHEPTRDPRTLQLAEFFTDTAPPPEQYDFDSTRKYPFSDVGKSLSNSTWGDCVMATVARNWARLERVESYSLYEEGLTAKQVVDQYFKLTGGVDSGLNMLSTCRWWRSQGWTLSLPGRPQSIAYKIAAFGELPTGQTVSERKTIKRAIYLLRGCQFGFALPLTAQADTDKGRWDYHPNVSGNTPGSWGGHAVYGNIYGGYSSDGDFTVYSWGMKIKVSAAFMAHYCDEMYAVVDALDHPTSSYLNVAAMEQKLGQVASGIEQ